MIRFMKKNIFNKIVLTLIIVLLFSFAFPSNQASAVDLIEEAGTFIVKGVTILVRTVVTGVIDVLEVVILGREAPCVIDGNPNIVLSPGLIFSNKVALFDCNFINPSISSTIEIGKNTKIQTNIASSANILKTTIATWYKTLRYIAIVGLLIVLVYTGIKILISSASSTKAKYKQLLTDWLVALILVVSMHYVMALLINVTSYISGALGNVALQYDTATTESGETLICDHYMREVFQKAYPVDESQFDASRQFGYHIMMIMLIAFTCIFCFQYIKRFLYLAFFTLISPIVCFMYPIDKMNDGKAQSFEIWFKEYLFNLLIQPFHLLLYAILMGTAQQLAEKSTLYGIAVLAFMFPAEKFLKKLFGFEKATTPSFAGAAAATAVGHQIARLGKNTAGLKGGSNNSSKGEGNSSKIRIPKDTSAATGLNAFASDSSGSTSGGGLPTGGAPSRRGLPTGGTTSGGGLPTGGAESGGGLPTGGTASEGGLPTGGVPSKKGLPTGGAVPKVRTAPRVKSATRVKSTPSGTAPIRKIAKRSSNSMSNTKVQPQNSRMQNAKKLAIKKAKSFAGQQFTRDNFKNAGKLAGRMIGGAIGAAALGSTALGIGLTTGDLKNAALIGGAGLASGYKLGGNLGEGAVGLSYNAFGGIRDIATEINNGEDEARRIKNRKELKRAEKQFMKDDEQRKIAENFKDTLYKDDNTMTVDDIQAKMFKYHSQGITDEKDIEGALRLESKGKYTQAQAANISKFKTSSEQLTDLNQRANVEARVRSQLAITGSDTEENVAKVMRGLDMKHNVSTEEMEMKKAQRDAQIEQERIDKELEREERELRIEEMKERLKEKEKEQQPKDESKGKKEEKEDIRNTILNTSESEEKDLKRKFDLNSKK